MASGSTGRNQDVERAQRSRQAASTLKALGAVESGLDPTPARRGQVIADLVTVLLVAVVVLVLGFPIENPLLLVALLVIGTGTTRTIRHLRSRRLRKERQCLLDELDGPPHARPGLSPPSATEAPTPPGPATDRPIPPEPPT